MNYDTPNMEEITALIIDALEEMKAKDIITIDVQNISDVTDTMIIASGTSKLHVKSLAENVAKRTKENNFPPKGIEGLQETEWVLVDLGDIIVHVMTSASRQFYDLESLWNTSESLESVT